MNGVSHSNDTRTSGTLLRHRPLSAILAIYEICVMCDIDTESVWHVVYAETAHQTNDVKYR
jgi:hypothetical protein